MVDYYITNPALLVVQEFNKRRRVPHQLNPEEALFLLLLRAEDDCRPLYT
jgi:hypothetical protein